MAKEVELRRHTDNDGDVLTPDGVVAAVGIGRRLEGTYQLVASSGAQRATQTVACLLAGLAELVPGGVIIEEGLRSTWGCDRWPRHAPHHRDGRKDGGAHRQERPSPLPPGAALVVAAIAAALAALSWGFTAVMLTGAACYGGATLLSRDEFPLMLMTVRGGGEIRWCLSTAGTSGLKPSRIWAKPLNTSGGIT